MVFDNKFIAINTEDKALNNYYFVSQYFVQYWLAHHNDHERSFFDYHGIP